MFDQQHGTPDQEPPWLGALTALFGADPQTGWMDSDAALEAMGWLARQVFTQSRTDRGYHTRAGLEAQVRATARVSNSLAAVQAVRIAQFAATERAGSAEVARLPQWTGPEAGDTEVGDVDDDGTECAMPSGDVLHSLGFKAEFADTELGAALCWGPMQATNRVEEAIDVVTKTPRLLAQMGAGLLDAYRASQVTRELVEAGDRTCRRVQDELLERGVTGWTSRRIAARTRSLVVRMDPAAARVIRRKRAKDAINVITRPGEEAGTTQVSATLWSQDAMVAFAAVEELAKALHASTRADKTLGECRADAMVDLILDRAQVQTNLTLLVPIKAQTNQTPPEQGPQQTPAERTSTDEAHSRRAHTCPARLDEDLSHPEQGGADWSEGSWAETILAELAAEIDWDAEFDRLVQWYDPPPGGVVFDPGQGGRSDRVSTGGTAPQAGHDPATRTDPQEWCVGDPPPGSDPPSTMNTISTGEPRPDGTALDGQVLCDVEVPGIGMIGADDIRAMLHTVGVGITRALIDQDSGVLMQTRTSSYRPTAGIRRFVVRRDRHCRFVGCDRDAKFCDVDHVRPWPEGDTTAENLQLLCRFHHRAKHEGGWQVSMDTDGVCTWVSPTGRTYITRPGLLDVTSDLTVTPGSAPLDSTPWHTPEHCRTSLHDP